jgi:hypothetical protein
MIKNLVSLFAPNQNQFQSYVAHAISAGGVALAVAHPSLGPWLSPQIVGALAAFLGVLYSHALHGAGSGTGSTPPLPGLFVVLLSAALLASGCSGIQVTTHESGYGAKGRVVVPVPGTQTSLIDGSLIVGWFKTTTAVQPTATNRLYAPSIAVADLSDGADAVTGGVGGGTNSSAGITSGTRDKYLLISGDTTADIATNRVRLDGYNGFVPGATNR